MLIQVQPLYISNIEDMQDINTLLAKIKQYNESYRNGEPQISDSEYDSLVEELKTIDPENEWSKHIEPSPVHSSRKRKLPLPMKSLNKVKSVNDLKKWFTSLGLNGNTELVLMPKFDGLSLLHNEQTGEAWSRGGAENEGQDCTEHCIAANITSNTKYLHTYGEFIISRKNWEDYFNGKHSPYTGEIYKSPRNTAAGFLNRDEPCAEITHASFFRYGIDPTSLSKFDSFHDAILKICNDYNQEHLYEKVSVKEITEQSLLSLFKTWAKIYPIDGIVIYINDLRIWDSIGRHQTTGNPLYAIAYKHPDFTDAFETTVKGISWKASKSGALKPVVNIEMVNTGDCNMENPTGYNAGWVYDHHIARGAKILVTRSGGVIPKILETLENATEENENKQWEELCSCPHCGAPTVWNDKKIELMCSNPNCSGKELAKIVFFYTTCGAENMGEETISKIYNAGFTTISDMLNITFDELMHIDGFAEGISNIILENNRKIMNGLDMATLMHASDCFTGIGKIKAQKILDDMNDEERNAFYGNSFIYDHDNTDSITMQNFYAGCTPFFQFVQNIKIPVIPYKKAIVTDGRCSGMNICVSGFRDSSFEQKVQESGGKIVNGVSKNTTHLVVKDKNGTSSKITKAQSMGVAIFSIEEFLQNYIH